MVSPLSQISGPLTAVPDYGRRRCLAHLPLIGGLKQCESPTQPADFFTRGGSTLGHAQVLLIRVFEAVDPTTPPPHPATHLLCLPGPRFQVFCSKMGWCCGATPFPAFLQAHEHSGCSGAARAGMGTFGPGRVRCPPSELCLAPFEQCLDARAAREGRAGCWPQRITRRAWTPAAHPLRWCCFLSARGCGVF